MVTDAFGAMLQELSKALNIPDLHPDSNNCCLIKFKTGLQVQLELDRTSSALLAIVDLGQVPNGRYRESLFGEALKSNGLPPPRYGIFAYSKQADRFIYFEKFELQSLNGTKLAESMKPFLEMAKLWKDSIAKGNVPIVSAETNQSPPGIFGLRP